MLTGDELGDQEVEIWRTPKEGEELAEGVSPVRTGLEYTS